MKKIYLSLLLTLTIGLFAQAQTSGDLSVSVSTSNAGGNYAPRNIVAVWVEDSNGDFVKTLLSYAQTFKHHLNNWEASTTAAGSVYNTVDAITGATKTSHATRTCTWDGTDLNGTLVADGAYKLCMELTDKNSTGNYSLYDFTKGANVENQTPGNQPSFSSVSIVWTPAANSIATVNSKESFFVFPNPTKGVVNIAGENIENIEISNITGQQIYMGNNTSLDISDQPNGLYLIKIKSDEGSITKKVMKY